MALPNLFTAQFEPDPADPEGFRAASLRASVPGDQLIVKLMEIEPGNHLCPYHYEYVEEWLAVIVGEADVRTPEGTRRLQAGDMVRFPVGPDGAHRVSSPPESTGPTRVLMFSPDADPAVCVYPDSDKLAVYTREQEEDEVFVRRSERSSHLDYFDGETPVTPPVGPGARGGCRPG